MATVYHARDVRLDRIVALKIAHPDLARDQEFVSRFISEARSAARLSSPNVVAVFDQGSTADLHYIAMEYVPGPTLRELLVARGRLNPREALDIIERVLVGLAAAHDAGIIHRDVKPENVLLGNGTSVKVADFGLARAAAGFSHTKTGLLIGTAAYLAPEQVASSTSDQRSDVYAVGVMLFEMLTGTQPHTGETPLAVAYKHVNFVVPAPSSVNPDLPAALDALVALGTSRDPELRPPDARHYLRAITEVRRGLPLPSVARGGAEAGAVDSAYRPEGSQVQSFQSFQDPAWPEAATRGNGLSGGPNATGPPHGRGDVAPYPTASYGPAMAGLPGANHTMIVPTDSADDYAGHGGFGDRPPRRLRSRGYRDPFLQRWLFSRRILFILGAVVVAIIAWWLAEGQYFPVPAVAGMTLSTAKADLANAGLVGVSGPARHSNTVPAGDVIASEPTVGARITHGGRVILIRSLGPVLITVPQVTGQTLKQADKALKNAGLTPAHASYQASASIPQGEVIATNPVAYTHWPQDKPVHIVVSAGVPLPNFVGQQVGAAQGAAQAGGFSINQMPDTTSTQPAGTITRQSQPPGTPVTSGEVVTVWVSQGPQQVPVPDVQGMNINDAENALTAAGFQVSVNQVLPGNRVLSYSPTGTAPQGSTITITVGL
jgi:eukaryotic-like serine/threonine-protein kinase